MKTYNLHWHNLPYYITLGDVLYQVERFCKWWHLEEDHNPEKYTYTLPRYPWEKFIIRYHSFDSAKQYLGLTEKYKFIKAKVKKLVEEKYVRIVVGNNYWIDQDDMYNIVNDYLEITKQ